LNYDPGANEIEWLTDIKPLAERVGYEVFGRTIHWRVETKAVWRGKRPDRVVEFADDKRVIVTGEAKRPTRPSTSLGEGRNMPGFWAPTRGPYALNRRAELCSDGAALAP
jgi:hypothetical protein